MASSFEDVGGGAAETSDAGPAAALLVERLTGVLDAESVISDAACQAYAVGGAAPAVVAKPADVEGVSAALALASELGAAVVPWGGGSRMAIGLPPRRCDMVLSLERLRGILAYDPADLTLSVQAGITHAELARTLAASGQMLPLDVPLPERATLGGTLATATVGVRRAFYGGPRDLVLGLRVVDARGTVLKTGGQVVKNVTGYDMSKLYIGALGTLGVIVEANLKLTPIPEAEGTLLGTFAQADDALAAAESLDALGVRPSAVAVVQVGALAELASLVPDHKDYALVVARFPGAPYAVARAIREGEAALNREGARTTLSIEGVAQAPLWAAIDDFAQCAHRGGEVVMRMAAQPSECATLLDIALHAGKENGSTLTWLIDAASGTFWLRVRAGGDASTDRLAVLGDTLVSLREALLQSGRAPTILTMPMALAPRVALWEAPGAMHGLMRDIKKRFDPEGLLNPGRFVVG